MLFPIAEGGDRDVEFFGEFGLAELGLGADRLDAPTCDDAPRRRRYNPLSYSPLNVPVSSTRPIQIMRMVGRGLFSPSIPPARSPVLARGVLSLTWRDLRDLPRRSQRFQARRKGLERPFATRLVRTQSRSLAAWRSRTKSEFLSSGLRLTRRPRCTAGRAATSSRQRLKWRYSASPRNLAAPS